ncbi:MAG: sulfatase-like hydrolase/transferase [bacterium]|nr:sulfatase-like hydrolase/transferase [bacterium]
MPKRHPNIVIFAIDSIRRDHMSCYGYSRLTTPYMDQLAARGTLFENAFSPYIPTTPAYSSMLTGADVITTQMPSLRPTGPLPKELPTMPEILRKAGYNTTCVGFGGDFYRGFNKYLNFEGWCSYEDRPARKAENLNAVTIPELERLSRSKKPFMLFLRHMDPHAPYLPPAPYDTMFYSKDPCKKGNKSMKPVFAFKPFADFLASWMPPGITDKDHVIAQYDGEIAYMDACIQQLITRMEELGVMDETLIVITGDHGETLYDHDCFFDHHGLYEPTLVVPLIYYWPGKVPEGVRANAYTMHEDLMPTVLDVCGLRKHAKGAKFDGKSNKRFFTDTENTHRSEFYISECTWMRKQGWRTPIWKFWEALEPDFHGKPPVELYNLVEDPEELVNLAEKEPQIVELLRTRMNKWIKRRERRTGKTSNIMNYELGTDLYIGSIATAKKLQAR